MSWVQSQGVREKRRPRGEEGIDVYYGSAIDQKIHRPSSEGLERRIGFPHQPEMASETRPRYSVHGRQMLPLPTSRESSLGWQDERPLPPSFGREEERRLRPPQHSSAGWQEERRLPAPRTPSPSPHKGRPLADSDTLPARWRNAQPTKEEAQDTDQRQSASKGAKVHFQRPAERRQSIPEDDEEEGSGSSSDSSFERCMGNIEKSEDEPDDRNLLLSYCFDVIEHEGAESGDENGYVYVPRGRSP